MKRTGRKIEFNILKFSQPIILVKKGKITHQKLHLVAMIPIPDLGLLESKGKSTNYFNCNDFP